MGVGSNPTSDKIFLVNNVFLNWSSTYSSRPRMSPWVQIQLRYISYDTELKFLAILRGRIGQAGEAGAGFSI